MNRFGKGDRNGFFGDGYEKAKPVSLNTERGKDLSDKQDMEGIKPSRKVIREEDEETARLVQDKSKVDDSDKQDTDLFLPRRRRPVIEQEAKSYASRGHSSDIKPPASATPRNYDRPPTRDESRGGGGKNKKGKNKKRLPIATAILIDVLVTVLLFVFFCQQNNFFIFDTSGHNTDDKTPTVTVSDVITPSSTTETASASPKATGSQSTKSSPKPTTSPSPKTTIDPSSLRAKFASKFSSDGKVHQQSTANGWTYQSANIDVNVTKTKDNNITYYVTDIYIADIKYFKTWYSTSAEYVSDALQKVNGVVGINGDYYSRNGGLTVRNSQNVAYAKTSDDELVMYTDGKMQAFSNKDFDVQGIKAQVPDKVYQVWGFGPTLLDANGQPLTKFNSSVTTYNPRTAIGYYEPGHYCFVTVDGRQPGYSDPGYNMKEIAQLMSKLGCKIAFNLDGGGSTQLAFTGKEINKACSDKRRDVDIIYITDQG